MQFDPEQQGKVMLHQCPLLEITPGNWSGPTKELRMGQHCGNSFRHPLLTNTPRTSDKRLAQSGFGGESTLGLAQRRAKSLCAS